MNRDLIAALVQKHEGTRLTVYSDSDGNLTIGTGFDLDALGAEAVCSGLGINYANICSGVVSLSDEQATDLFDHSLNIAIAGAQKEVPNFDALPDRVQAVCVDLAFNLGATGLSEFKNFIAALAIPDYHEAAAQLKSSLWCNQVGSRCVDNCSILESAA